MKDYMNDMPGSGALIEFVRAHIGEGHGALDASKVWNARWLNYLKEFDAAMFKLIGDELVPALYDNAIGFMGSGVASLSFDGVPLVLFKRYLGGMEGSHYWVFYPKGGGGVAKKLSTNC